ncbi:helix-turn-helix transcriptional regulator [Nitrobacteraceae bacterium UC4446_H13]
MTAKLTTRRPIIRLALSRVEVALAIGVSVTSVDQMVVEGALPPPRKWHSRKLWLVAEIEAHLNDLPIEGQEREDPYEKWKDRQFEPIQREPVKGAGGNPTITDPIKKYYDGLGFDPATMGKEDLWRLTDAARERWKASIPNTPLGKRESEALTQLAAHGVGIAVSFSQVKNCGLDTVDRLLARGFIETRSSTKFPDRISSCVLTEAGMRATEGTGVRNK